MADEEDAFEERAAITEYEEGFPPLVCDGATGLFCWKTLPCENRLGNLERCTDHRLIGRGYFQNGILEGHYSADLALSSDQESFSTE
jgi:hypothetical protein